MSHFKNLLEQLKEKSRQDLLKACKTYERISKLEKISKYFHSEEWKDRKSKNLDEAHKHADLLLSEIFEHYIIYDDSKVIYGQRDLLDRLSEEQRRHLENVESEKNENLTIVGDYVFQHIGSTHVGSLGANLGGSLGVGVVGVVGDVLIIETTTPATPVEATETAVKVEAVEAVVGTVVTDVDQAIKEM